MITKEAKESLSERRGTGLFAGRLRRPRDWGIGALLGLLYVILVMQTTSMGITRDESFYIHYGKVYTNWFTRIARAEGDDRGKLLSRRGVKKVWKQNFEHPPLMKVLFGASWRFLGRKERLATFGPDGKVKIRGLGISHGFEPDDEVVLLGPAQVGHSLDERVELGRVLVNERHTSEATGQFAGDMEAAAEICAAAAESPGSLLTDCRVVSAGPLQFFSESDAFRFPGALLGGLLILMIFLLGVEFGSTAVGLLTVALFAFVPRVFFHAHLTCFDIPITALSFTVLYAFVRSLSSTRWAFVTALLWGIALLAKLNAFFLPITLMMWWGVAGIRSVRARGWQLSLPRFPLAFLLMPAIGLPMLFIFWPWLWYDSIESFGKYLGFHLDHEHYFQYYFGRAYQSPPFPIDLPFVLTLLTVPVVTTVLFLVGFGRGYLAGVASFMRGFGLWYRKEEGLLSNWGRGWFVFINLAFPVTLIALPGTPVFGGVKHWLLTMPFYCLVAAHGLCWLLQLAARGIEEHWPGMSRPSQWIAAGAVSLVLLAPSVRDTVRYAPYGTAYYNELVGGSRGAAQARMQRQFWSFASRTALDFVNWEAPAEIAVDFQDATRGTCQMQQREGWMRDDLDCATRKPAPALLLFDVEERFAEEEMRYWDRMDTLGPIFEGGIDGLPLVRVYRRHAGLSHQQDRLEE
jgi:hypothetical protein